MFREDYAKDKEFHKQLLQAKIMINAAVDGFKNSEDKTNLIKTLRSEYKKTFDRFKISTKGYVHICIPLMDIIEKLGCEKHLLISLSYSKKELNDFPKKYSDGMFIHKAALEECLHYFMREVNKVYKEYKKNNSKYFIKYIGG